MENNRYIIDTLEGKNISMLGFADISEVSSEQRQGLRYGICVAVALNVFPSESEPHEDYYNEYRKLNATLKEICLFLEEKITERGYSAYSLFRNKQNEDFRTLLPFKTLATRAGLGWIGKSSTLVTREFGNAVRLGGVITDMPFETAEPINKSFCRNCNACVEACPAGAIKGDLWELGRDRDEMIDPVKCKNKVIERGEKMGVKVGSCGICLSVCPWTRKYMESKLNYNR